MKYSFQKNGFWLFKQADLLTRQPHRREREPEAYGLKV